MSETGPNKVLIDRFGHVNASKLPLFILSLNGTVGKYWLYVKNLSNMTCSTLLLPEIYETFSFILRSLCFIVTLISLLLTSKILLT